MIDSLLIEFLNALLARVDDWLAWSNETSRLAVFLVVLIPPLINLLKYVSKLGKIIEDFLIGPDALIGNLFALMSDSESYSFFNLISIAILSKDGLFTIFTEVSSSWMQLIHSDMTDSKFSIFSSNFDVAAFICELVLRTFLLLVLLLVVAAAGLKVTFVTVFKGWSRIF